MKYIIIDTCECKETQGYKDDKGEFDVKLYMPISFNLFQRALKCDILAYAECYGYDGEIIRDQFIQNIMELLNGKNICINGMKYIIEGE